MLSDVCSNYGLRVLTRMCSDNKQHLRYWCWLAFSPLQSSRNSTIHQCKHIQWWGLLRQRHVLGKSIALISKSCVQICSMDSRAVSTLITALVLWKMIMVYPEQKANHWHGNLLQLLGSLGSKAVFSWILHFEMQCEVWLKQHWALFIGGACTLVKTILPC